MAAVARPCSASADPIKTTIDAKINDGYARLVFTMSGYNDASFQLASNILVIDFKKPIDVSVDRLPVQLPGYIGAARRDPDGSAVRFALERAVKVDLTSTGQKLFVDLLPDTWTGLPPGLPQDVIADLAQRAREADAILRKAHQAEQQQMDLAPVRVHVGVLPTFTRYVFDVPAGTSVAADHPKDQLLLTFDAPIKFDLADAEAALPHAVETIDTQTKGASTLVHFVFADKVDVRTFRDGQGYDVDVITGDADSSEPGIVPPVPQQGARLQMPPAIAKPLEAAAGNIDTPAAVTKPPAVAAPSIAPAPRPVAVPSPSTTPPPPQHAASQPASPTPAIEQARSAVPPAPATAPTKTAASTVAPVAAPQPTPRPSTAKPDVPAAKPQPAPASTTAAAPKAATKNVAASAASAAPAVPQAPAAAAVAKTASPEGGGRVVAELAHHGDNLTLTFPFTAPTAGAVFQRADTLWIVFDSAATIDLGALQDEASHTIRSAKFTRAANADIVRIKLDRPHLSSVGADGSGWSVQIGDKDVEPAHALAITRDVIGPNRSSITIPFQEPHLVHRLEDPEAGDPLIVVTGFLPARGFVNTKGFVEFRALASTQGVVVEPLADDIRVELTPDKIVITRPSGLTLSTSLQTLLHGSGLRPDMFDSQLWGSDQKASYAERQSDLIAAAAAAPENKRLTPRLDLARFYLARGMYPEAKGVLDVTLQDERPDAENASALVLRSVAEIMMNRPDDALKDLSDPAVGDQHDATLWRALVYARQGKWEEARRGFESVESEVDTLPVELQRTALKEEVRSAIEVGDFSDASHQLNDFKTIGIPHDMEPSVAVLIGRLAEGLGRTEDALAAYRTAADSWDRRAAAQGKLRETLLRYSLGDLKRDEVISDLETLTTVWRGDETEIEALQVLAQLYTEEGRYRDAFYVMRSAVAAHPDWAMTRKIQAAAAATFDALFLAGKGDSMPAIDALALFYDFRELTPIGARGDEMIRRLADRLVSVDLLDQAAALLQYQVDNRLQGAARAQVGTRLAVIYLMNRKSDRALATLRATRTADLSNELRDQRLLLEARALSDMGRHELALEVIADVDGRAAIRLRSDIYWAAKRWRESAEQIELMYGERWKEWQPLNDVERADILRAEIGYALAQDTLGLSRFREKYAAKMAQTPDAHAFEVVSAPLGTNDKEFGEIARDAASDDTLDGFLREMQAQYPEASAIPPPLPAVPDAAPAVSAAKGPKPTSAQTAPQPPSLVPPPRAAGRTAQR